MFRHLSKGVRVFQKGETIIRQGEPVPYLYLLQSGSCYRYLITPKGNTIIYEIKEPDNSFSCLIGVLTVYNQSGMSNYTFVARTICECLCIPAADFIQWASDKAEVQNELLRLAMAFHAEVSRAFQFHQEGRIANRLCSILVGCCTFRDNEWRIEKKYSFSELANMLGVHAVTVSRIIRCLCEEQVLSKAPDGLLVTDMDKLVAYASDSETLPYK